MRAAQKYQGFSSGEIRYWTAKIWLIPIVGAYLCNKAMKIEIRSADAIEGAYFTSPKIAPKLNETENELDL